MSFLTSFIFFFSTGCPECPEANFSVAIGWSFSSRTFGVLAGALFVRRLAILVSFLSSLAHLFALRPRELRLADFVQRSLGTCAEGARGNPLPFCHIPFQQCFLLVMPTQKFPALDPDRPAERVEKHPPVLVLATQQVSNQPLCATSSRAIVELPVLSRSYAKRQGTAASNSPTNAPQHHRASGRQPQAKL